VKVRPEAFGAWIALDDATMVAVDRARARALGIDGGALWNDALPVPAPAPLEAHVAVTARCPVACSGCYQNASPSGHDVPTDSLLSTLDALRDAGVFTVAFGGGEPIARDDLAQLAEAARARGLVPVVTTSGLGLTPERARALRAFAQVNVSHDGVHGAYRAVRGFEGAHVADRAIALLVAEGVTVGVNYVLTRESFAHIEDTAAHVRAQGARELQLLRYKPAGRAASLDYLARRLTPAQIHDLVPLLERLARAHGDALSVRIDCALVPFLSAHLRDAASLSRWGIFGCEAGRHLTAVTREGALAPCSFVDPEPEASSSAHALSSAWHTDAALARFRTFVEAPPAPCATCSLRSACRGGCKVVSMHLAGAFVPDPECPRVRAHAAEAETPA
jgi:radical SAM protein with 4Fe4S-binding SPASM domain